MQGGGRLSGICAPAIDREFCTQSTGYRLSRQGSSVVVPNLLGELMISCPLPLLLKQRPTLIGSYSLECS